MDGPSAVKKHKLDCESQVTVSSTMDNLISENESNSSSSISHLLTEADKAIQESNKRHVKPVIEESSLGIELFIGETKNQFHGLIKTRYADFVVHETDLDGNEARLTNLDPPVEEEATNSLKLEDLFERKVLVCLSNVSNGLLDSYKIDVTGLDKEMRTSIHHAIRESYDRLESSTISDRVGIEKKDKKSATSASAKVDSSSTEVIKAQDGDNSNPIDRKDDSSAKNPSNSDDNEATTEAEEKRFILVTRRNKSSRNRSVWPRGRPDYLRFVLYKENKDTMDAIHNLAVATSTKPSIFTYAGTKDRRAITAQWVTAWRVDPKRLIGAMRRFNKRPYLKVGNFSYREEPIRLGQLRANRFDIVIRHLVHNSGGQQVIEESIESIKERGFVNYFGLQRFGTRTIQTHQIGLAILQSEWAKAIDLILSYRHDEQFPQGTNVDDGTPQDKKDGSGSPKTQHPIETELQKSTRQQGKYWSRGAEQHNACIDLWKAKRDSELVFKKFPHFRITNEGLIIKALSKFQNEASPDYSAALSSLPRNTRSMYVHSYQSLLWNKLVTFRLRKHGYKVVKGDLVLPSDKINTTLDIMMSATLGDEVADTSANSINENGPESVSISTDQSIGKQGQEATSDLNSKKDDILEDIHSKILVVSDEDKDNYTIFDVVLPLPGSRIKVPQNETGAELERLLEEDGLTLQSFKAREKIFVSYGSYRRIIVKPDNLNWDIKQYSNPRENLIENDLDLLNRELSTVHLDRGSCSPVKSDSCDEALVISFDLPPSSYATMCLRELMKKPSTDFNNRF